MPWAPKEPATPASQYETSKTRVLNMATPEDSWANRLPCPAPAKRLENREAIDSEALPRHRQDSRAEDCERQEVGSTH